MMKKLQLHDIKNEWKEIFETMEKKNNLKVTEKVSWKKSGSIEVINTRTPRNDYSNAEEPSLTQMY